MNTLTLYYSVSDGGDGSAYPKFSLSKELVDIHQDMEGELIGQGWGEPCVGEITLKSESPIFVEENQLKYFITKESLLETLEDYLDEDGEYDNYKAEQFANIINQLVL